MEISWNFLPMFPPAAPDLPPHPPTTSFISRQSNQVHRRRGRGRCRSDLNMANNQGFMGDAAATAADGAATARDGWDHGGGREVCQTIPANPPVINESDDNNCFRCDHLARYYFPFDGLIDWISLKMAPVRSLPRCRF